jgi:hypothetical protein
MWGARTFDECGTHQQVGIRQVLVQVVLAGYYILEIRCMALELFGAVWVVPKNNYPRTHRTGYPGCMPSDYTVTDDNNFAVLLS